MRRLSPLVFAICCACSAPSKPSVAASPGAAVAAPVSLYDALVAEAGDAVAFVAASDEGAVVAATPDRVLRTLVPGADGAHYQWDLDLIWARRGDDLVVLDLRQPDPEPVAIASGVPDAPVFIDGKMATFIDGGGAPEYLTLEWSARPALGLELSFGEIINDETAAAIEKAELVGRDWLVAQAGRAPRTDSPGPAETSKGAGPVGSCDDDDLCGLAVEFGASGWQLYISAHQCGDYCHSSCLLFEPGAARVALPRAVPTWSSMPTEEGGASCGPYYFDPSGAVYAHGDEVCRVGEGCVRVGGVVLGLLRPGAVISVGR